MAFLRINSARISDRFTNVDLQTLADALKKERSQACRMDRAARGK